MKPAELRTFIETHFSGSNRAFIDAFNEASGIELDETVLSRQLNGKRGLSNFARAAYTLFCKFFKQPQGENLES